jgi:hypothetical protein
LPSSAFHRRGHYTKSGTRSACRECTAADVRRLREEREGKDSGDANAGDVDAHKKALVRARTRRAVEQGIIVPSPCRDCGAVEVEAHHESYDGKRAHLEVIWLCKRHHALHHGERLWTRQLDLRL